MIAWVLIVSLGMASGYAISGIVSEQECKKLHEKIAATYTLKSPTLHCLPYMIAK
jgi:hypothetical protein